MSLPRILLVSSQGKDRSVIWIYLVICSWGFCDICSGARIIFSNFTLKGNVGRSLNFIYLRSIPTRAFLLYYVSYDRSILVEMESPVQIFSFNVYVYQELNSESISITAVCSMRRRYVICGYTRDSKRRRTFTG